MTNGLRRRISSTPMHWISKLLALFLLIGTAFTSAQAAISFVQTNSATPQTAQNPVTVTYTAAQTAGDLNVVVVGWNDSTVTVSTVVDSAGNSYALAVGPTVQTGTATQAIYYAKNIKAAAANGNVVTVTFSAAPRFPDIRIAEYKGLDLANPLDVFAAAQGNSATSNSGAVTTTTANDLIIGANLVQSTTKTAGSGYTSRGITADGDILEDKTVTVTGSNSATANLDITQPWIMQLVAFRAAPAGPSITGLSQSSGAIGAPLTITGAGFGASQGTSTVTFNGVSAGVASAWSATSITVNVPATATTGNVVVTVSGVASNGVAFTVAPTISSLSQPSGAIGTQITITGTGFAASQGGSTVTFGGASAGVASAWSTTSITVNVPAAAVTGNVVVTVSSLTSNAVAFTVAPNITSLSQNSGGVGTQITITGTNFGSSQTGNSVTFGGTAATTFSSWSSTSIGVTVPAGANTGNVVVTVSALASNGVNFTVVTPPSITSLSAPSGAIGTPLTITGTGFGGSQGTSTVTFGGVSAGTASAWSATSVTVNVPAAAVTGNVVVTVSGAASNGVAFTVVPNITSLSQSSGAAGTQITITGTNFGSSQAGNSVTFGGTAATTFSSWSSTSIGVTVPAGANTGNVVVTVGALASNGVNFTIISPPNISSLSQSSGTIGTSITITGANFGSSQGTSAVTFGGTTATTFSTWTATSIGVTVPAGAVTGNVVVTVSSVASNGVAFGVTPNITSLSQTSGTIGTSITVTGAGFGASQGSSTVTFGGTPAITFSSWTATSIGVTVPVGASTGNVVVTVGALASNGVNFTVVPPAAISFVQGNSATPQASPTSLTVTYTAAQTAGDLNVVVVGWNDSTARVSSVADSLNNTYTLAIGPTVQTGTATQAIYYAKSIAAAAANTNIVTVTFATAATHPDIRIAEYTGIDPTNPLDVAAAAQGNSATSSSGSATTTSGSDLLVGANVVQSTTTAPGTGYTSRGITPDGDILEDQVVAITGSYSATAVLNVVQPWIMQMVAFRAAPGGGGAPPSITMLSQASGAIGTPITITGTNFGSSQGTSTVTFNGISAGTASVWTATSITVNVPAAATTGNVVVTVSSVASNGVAFTVAPNITSLSQLSGTIGTAITITGTNFGSSQGTSTVTFNGISAGTASAWGATSIAVNVPTAATSGSVVVTVGSLSSNGIAFTVAPTISSLSQASGAIGTQITITGTGFAASQGSSAVTFGGASAGVASTWSTTSITVNVPVAAVTGNVVVSVSGLASNGVAFTVAPNISSLSQNSGGVGTQITITGTNFGSSQAGNSVTFGGTAATTFSSWTSTSIGVTVPAGANTGNVVVTVGALASNGVNFTVVTPPSISSLSAPSGAIGTALTITGTGFGASQGTSTVTFGGVSSGTASAWTATSITVNVPAAAVTGNVVVTVSGAASNGVAFTVAPNITSLSQPSGQVGTQITITGTNFGSSQTGNSVTFGGTAATTFASWSATSITVTVPAGANSGNVVVTVGALSSNGIGFTVVVPPSISGLSAPSGSIGTPITITGTNFGSSQGTSTVTFNGISAGVASAWSATSITVNVPAAATTGSVVVTVSSLASNGVAFIVAPNITGLSQFSGAVGTAITITGTNFGSSQTGNSVTFGGTAATVFSSWTSTSIGVTVPAGANTGNIVLTIGGLASNGVAFTVTTGIHLIQHVSKDAGSTTSSSLAFASANTAGDWIAIVIRAGRSNQVFTVTDSKLNVYHSAVQFNLTADTPNGDTLAIYYAENIAGGANTITVSDSINGSTLRFAIFEYSGVATVSSLDVTKAAQGTSTAPNSGNTTTTASGDLLLGEIATGNGETYAASTGYVAEERVPAAPNTKLMAEDQIQVAAGTASASASLSASDVWGAVLATFKPAGAGGGGTNPTITSLSQTSGAIGTPITITGANFGSSQGTSTVTFNGVSAGTASAWTTGSITVNVPAGATTGNIVVTVSGLASNGVNFAVAPQITSLSQASGASGTPITITGTNFGTSQGTSTVTFGGVSAGAASAWSATSITVNVPATALTGNVVVTVSSVVSNGVAFTVAPNITSLSQNSGGAGTQITITGTNFGTSQTGNSVTFGGTAATTFASWSSTSIGVTVPAGANTGNVVVTVGALASNGVNFTVVAPAAISFVQGNSAAPQATISPVAVTYTAAQIAGDLNVVVVGWNDSTATVSSVTDSLNNTYTLAAGPTVQSGTATQAIYYAKSIAAAAANTNTVTVTFSAPARHPDIRIAEYSGLDPANPLDVAAAAQGNSATSNSGAATTTNGSDLLVGANVVQSTTTGPGAGYTSRGITADGDILEDQVVAISGSYSATAALNIVQPWIMQMAAFRAASTGGGGGPSITSLGLSQGPVGATVTIAGANFGATQSGSTVTFNGTPATATNWSATSIDVTVPSGATTGNVVLTVGGVASNGMPFTVTPPPNITSISPTSGPIGTVVTINGTNFGPTVGTRVSLVLFNGLSARTNSWSNTQIFVPVPAGATSGNVVVSVGGVLSNGVNFTITNPPTISSLSQISGPVGTPVTITGTTFGATQGTSTVTFNGTAAAVSNWSDISISTTVPPGATTGNVLVTVNGAPSNGVNFTVTSSTSSAKFVQSSGKDGGVTTSSSLAFLSNNTLGNWIAVAIRAGTQGQVFTITDSNHNTYQKAVQLNQTLDAPNGDTLAIYYAENIAGGANTVTVSDTISNTLRFAILEYSGIASANSLDAFVGTQGTSTAPNSGNTFTAWGGDLLLGEVLTGGTANFTAGTGYTIKQTVPAEPNSKLMVEDQIQTGAGATSAAATLGVSDTWAAAVAAFKPAVGTPPPPISVTVAPTSASVGTGSGTQVFTATLQNDAQQKGVTWSLSGAGCSGSTCGTLSNVTTTSVTYTGPLSIPSPPGVTLTATSVADNTKSASASITVIQGPISVTLTPARSSETLSQQRQFTATVFNDPSNLGVTWMIDGVPNGNAQTGTITAGGLFTPGTVAGVHTVTATSVANSSANASVMTAVTDLAGVYTYHNDVGSTGQNLKEYALTTATVNSTTFGTLFSCPVDGYVYAQPLYVANLTIGATTRNVVFIATEHDSVYAFDADSPSCTQLWKVSFLSGTTVTTMPYQDTSLGTPYGATNDVFPEIGITSTPVIDPATNTIYVVGKTKETVGTGCSAGSPCYISRLHALNITTGAEKFGGPVALSAPNFVSLRHFNRPALLLNNGTVYVALGSHGDIPNWQGWVMAYNASTLAQKWVWNSTVATSGSNGGSVWGGGAGPVADPSGFIYVETGNGVFDGNKNYGDSVVKLNPTTGAVSDYFTPFDQAIMQANDIDMGSAGAMILPPSVALPNHPLVVAMGKVSILYMLDQTAMGTYHTAGNQDVQEVIPVPPPNTTQLDGGNYGTTAYWNGNIYTTGQNFPLSQFTIANGVISTPQFAVSANTFPPRGSTPAVSANGTTNGIVWVLDLNGWSYGTPAILDAYDATNVSTLLYSSPASGSNALGPAVKFTVPTVANGKVYVGTQSAFTVLGLLP